MVSNRFHRPPSASQQQKSESFWAHVTLINARSSTKWQQRHEAVRTFPPRFSKVGPARALRCRGSPLDALAPLGARSAAPGGGAPRCSA